MPQPPVPLAELFQAHRTGLAGAVRSVLGGRADVAEVLQDAFLKCWRALQQDPAPRDPVGWMFVVTWHVAYDARRRRQRAPVTETLDEDTQMELRTEMPPARSLEQREHVAAAEAAIAGLAEAEQQVFLLRVSAGLTFEAVAESLRIPVGTAKTRMRAALQKVRQRLGVSTAEPAVQPELQNRRGGKEARR